MTAYFGLKGVPVGWDIAPGYTSGSQRTTNIRLDYDLQGEYGGSTQVQFNSGFDRGYFPASGSNGSAVNFSTSNRRLSQYAGASKIQYYTIVPATQVIDSSYVNAGILNEYDNSYGLWPSGTMNSGDTLIGYNVFSNLYGQSELSFGSIFGAGTFSMPAKFFPYTGDRYRLRHIIYNQTTNYTLIRFTNETGGVVPPRGSLGISIAIQNPYDAAHPWHITPFTGTSYYDTWWYGTLPSGNVMSYKQNTYGGGADYNTLWYYSGQLVPTSGTYIFGLSSSTVGFY